MMYEAMDRITGASGHARPPAVQAILEGWRCRRCFGIRSWHDLTKADGLCQRCRVEADGFDAYWRERSDAP